MSTVLTVILNWRTPDMTLRSAEAALVALQGVEGALTIVDNDSGDGSFEKMAAAVAARGWDTGPHRVRVIQSGRNGGFGAGNNVGIRAGLPGGQAPDYVYVLNSDAFPEPGAIRALRDHLDSQPATGFAGSAIRGEDDHPHQTTFCFPSIATEFESQVRFGPLTRLMADRVVAQPIPARTGPCEWIAGASLMMRRAVLDDIGLFDETFFLYFEETELCHRATMAGWTVDFVRESRVVHIGSVSTGMNDWQRIPRFWLDSRLYYFTKVHGRVYAALATGSQILGGLVWRARLLIQRKDSEDPPRYLRDLTSHAIRAALGGPRWSPPAQAETRPATQGTDARSGAKE